MVEKSDKVIVQLGDNHLEDAKGVGQKAQALVRRILSQGKSCVWIGPAAAPGAKCGKNHGKKRAVSQAIKAALTDPAFVTEFGGRKCQFVDSFEATKSASLKSSDCLHYANYKPWADAIRENVMSDLDDSNESDLGAPSAPARMAN